MDASLSTLIGSAAGCIGLYSFVPQVVKCCRSGDVAAISLRMFAVRTFGLLLWTVYGFALGSMPVLIFSALGLMLSSVMLVLKVRGSRTQLMSESGRQHLPDQKDASAVEPVTG
jgi:MtN3 and saliva related transmembrane protein